MYVGRRVVIMHAVPNARAPKKQVPGDDHDRLGPGGVVRAGEEREAAGGQGRAVEGVRAWVYILGYVCCGLVAD